MSKVSISLDEVELAYLDAETRLGRYPSRSAAVQAAIRLLKERRLEDAYADAFVDWDDEEWDVVSGDGIHAA